MAIARIIRKGGVMLPNVATILPLTPFSLYPRNMEMFTANRPGADWEMARMSKNSCSSIHFFYLPPLFGLQVPLHILHQW